MAADDELGGWAIPAPAFKADEALVALKRQLRDLKPLAERGARYALQGRTVIEVAAGDGHLDARLAKRPATTPEWQRHRLASAGDVRRFVDAVRQALRRWEHED